MNGPLMPKATAVWLLENTALTFQQIANFCQLHILEVEAFANAEPGTIPMGLDPITSGQLLPEEIEASSSDPARPLTLRALVVDRMPAKKTARYTPLARRQDKPSAICWLLKNYPDLPDSRIVRLVGTTKNTIAALRDKSHWNFQNIKPQSPILLDMCTQAELDVALRPVTAPKVKAVKKKPKKVKALAPVKEKAVVPKEKKAVAPKKKAVVQKKKVAPPKTTEALPKKKVASAPKKAVATKKKAAPAKKKKDS